jgi:tetratricopeptide (TPR) repeat protein
LETLGKQYDSLQEVTYSSVIQEFSEMLKKNPYDIESYLTRSYLLNSISEDDILSTANDIVVALELSEDIEEFLLKSAISKLKASDFFGCIVDTNALAQVNSSLGLAFLLRGIAKKNLEIYESAIEDFSIALVCNNTDNAEVFFQRALCHLHKRNFSLALTDFHQARALNSHASLVYILLGDTHFILGNNDDAIRYYTVGISYDPDNIEPYFGRARIYFRTGQFEESIREYSNILGIKLLESRAYFERGLVYYEIGNEEEAHQNWKYARELGNKFVYKFLDTQDISHPNS